MPNNENLWLTVISTFYDIKHNFLVGKSYGILLLLPSCVTSIQTQKIQSKNKKNQKLRRFEQKEINVIHDENTFPINGERILEHIYYKLKRWNGKKVEYIILKTTKIERQNYREMNAKSLRYNNLIAFINNTQKNLIGTIVRKNNDCFILTKFARRV